MAVVAVVVPRGVRRLAYLADQVAAVRLAKLEALRGQEDSMDMPEEAVVAHQTMVVVVVAQVAQVLPAVLAALADRVWRLQLVLLPQLLVEVAVVELQEHQVQVVVQVVMAEQIQHQVVVPAVVVVVALT
jgi:hypothetical protein